MGYETGKGLGKNLQGRSTIVEAQFRTGRQGFGTCGKKNRPSKNFVKSEMDEKVVENFVEKFQNLEMEDHKATGRKKINYVYKSINQTYKSAHNSSEGRGEKNFRHFWGKKAVKTLSIPTVFSSF